MLKIMRDKWAKNEGKLKEAIAKIEDINELEYKDLVKLAFEEIFNDEEREFAYNKPRLLLKAITEIDDGDYQGTLVYLIPFDTYQPGEGDYLMTYVGYGSCSGCDTLQNIASCYHDRRMQNKDLLELCKDIITNTIKPYNHGWRYEGEFDVVEEKVDD